MAQRTSQWQSSPATGAQAPVLTAHALKAVEQSNVAEQVPAPAPRAEQKPKVIEQAQAPKAGEQPKHTYSEASALHTFFFEVLKATQQTVAPELQELAAEQQQAAGQCWAQVEAKVAELAPAPEETRAQELMAALQPRGLAKRAALSSALAVIERAQRAKERRAQRARASALAKQGRKTSGWRTRTWNDG